MKGIQQPVLQHRWRVRVPYTGWEDTDIITTQAVSISVNYATKELTLVIEQGVLGIEIHEMLFNMASSHTLIPISVEPLDGYAEVYHAIQYNCVLTDHKFDLDYSQNGTACHVATFEIKDLIPRAVTPREPIVTETDLI